ncbi:MAG: molybdate ABC transporter substrate-binding protein [Pigmentiphaga sp.]|nr:molybdate ABC transporter substrate-binding protein [Pigmentiphaga sp.]
MNVKRLALSAVFSLAALSTAHASEVIVGAAASLTNAFKAVGEQYEAENPGVKVTFTFGASDVVLQQIINGAPVDIFASADQNAMNKAADAKAIEPATRKDFVRNEVVLIAPKGAKVEVKSVADLKKAEVTRVAIGNPASVPVGRYTQAGLQQSGDWVAIEPKLLNAQNVRQALDYVMRGEVDAGFVFGTDAAVAADKVVKVQSLATPEAVLYPIALTTRNNRGEKAKDFQDYILSDKGQAILAKFGFQKP